MRREHRHLRGAGGETPRRAGHWSLRSGERRPGGVPGRRSGDRVHRAGLHRGREDTTSSSTPLARVVVPAMRGCTDEKRLLCPDHRVAEQRAHAVDGLDPRPRVVTGMSVKKNDALAFLTELIEADELTIVIDRTYPLEQIADAHRHVETGHKRGNVVFSYHRSCRRLLTAQSDRQTGTALENRTGTDQPTITTKSEDPEYLPAASSWQGFTTALRQPGRTASGERQHHRRLRTDSRGVDPPGNALQISTCTRPPDRSPNWPLALTRPAFWVYRSAPGTGSVGEVPVGLHPVPAAVSGQVVGHPDLHARCRPTCRSRPSARTTSTRRGSPRASPLAVKTAGWWGFRRGSRRRRNAA